MILFCTYSVLGTSDLIVHLLEERRVEVFRYNADLFNHYQFLWKDDSFEIMDPTGRKIQSCEVEALVVYKALQPLDEPVAFDSLYEDPKWIKSTLNYLLSAFIRWASDRSLLRLWSPMEQKYPKTFQMEVAKEFFAVPEFLIHWGFPLHSKTVIAKTLTQRPILNRQFLYAKKLDRNKLDPKYPWFTQEIADGDRDATVLYVNGKVFCFQFATPRGELDDWRVTQGSNRNRWEPWNAGEEFQRKVNEYMKKLGLKYGRLDFIIGGTEPQFLEVNPAGQFGWLDDANWTLHRAIVDAILDPASMVVL